MEQLELFIEFLKQNRRKVISNCKYLLNKNKLEKDSEYVLIDGATYGNLGDQAISYAESKFIETNFKKELFTILDFESDSSLKSLKDKQLDKKSTLFFNGGGNFGTLYPSSETIRRLTIKKFKDNKIVMFPQSIYFSSDIKGEYELELTKRIYSNHKNLVLVAREPKSYELMCNYFTANQVILVPDIVLSLDISKSICHTERKGIITLFRNDKEKALTNNESLELNKLIREKVEIVTESETHLGSEYDRKINNQNREEHLFKLWNKIASHELVITDRLHGMIFAYITQTPCIVFDNDNNKISETYNHWLKKCNFIKLLKDTSDVSLAIDELNGVIPEMLDFSESFSQLTNLIKK